MTEERGSLPGARYHRFRVARIGTARLTEWRGEVGGVLYTWMPGVRDNLAWVAEQHADGREWIELSPGYLYRRDDDRFLLTCSVMPAIGVWSRELNAAEHPPSRRAEPEDA